MVHMRNLESHKMRQYNFWQILRECVNNFRADEIPVLLKYFNTRLGDVERDGVIVKSWVPGVSDCGRG